jgi:TonB family protein
MNRRLPGVILAWLMVGLASAGAQSGSPLEHAKALYDSASFDEALNALDSLGRTQPETDVEEVQRYRALCLLALDRTSEAQSAIEVVFSRNPLYKLSENDAPPRMLAAFTEVRRRLLPKVTEQLYTAAKLSFDRKEYALAATEFQDLLTFLDDADARALPSLKEFRTLAAGFHDLSAAAPISVAKGAPPAPRPSAPAAPIGPPLVEASSAASQTPAGQTAGGQTVASQTVASQDPPGVLKPPVIVRQQMPLWMGMKDFLPRGNHGLIRVIIDEQGNVEEARVVESVHAVYDALLLSAARTWKYQPAQLDGRAVRYVKVIEVVLKPAP